jgi:predicted transcriptional regulator
MPIDMSKFSEGAAPKRKKLQINIMKILQKNPDKAVSSVDFERILNARRQAINQALRSLENKGMVERAYIKDGARNVTFVTIRVEYIKIDISMML